MRKNRNKETEGMNHFFVDKEMEAKVKVNLSILDVLENNLIPVTGTIVFFILTFFYFELINNKIISAIALLGALSAHYFLCWKEDKKTFAQINYGKVLIIFILTTLVLLGSFFCSKYFFYNLHRAMLNYFPSFTINNLISLVIIIPIVEEIIYRKIGGKVIDKSKRKIVMFFLMTILYAFATPHMYLWLPRFFMGLGLLLIRKEGKNILLCTFANILLTSMVLFVMSTEVFIDNSATREKRIEKRAISHYGNGGNEEVKKEIRFYTYIGDEVGSSLETILFRDGLLLMEKNNFIEFMKKTTGVKVEKESEDKYYFDFGSKRVEVDFEKMISTIEILDFSKDLDKNYEKVDFDENKDIISSYNEIQKKLFGKRLYKLTYNEKDFFVLNDLIKALDYDLLGKEFTEKEYIISNGSYEGFGKKEFKELNRFSTNKLVEIIARMEATGKFEDNILKEIEEKIEDFDYYFSSRLVGYTKKINKRFFRVVEKKDYFKSDKFLESYFETGEVEEKNYIKIDNFDFNQTKDLYDYFMSIDRNKDLVIDIKNLEGGNDFNMYYLLSILVNKDLELLYKIGGERVEVEVKDMSKLSYNGQIEVLTSRDTYGLGSIFASIIKDNNIGEIVGLNTSGGSYYEKVETLPNGIMINTLWDIEYMNREYESVDGGVEVDSYVE